MTKQQRDIYQEVTDRIIQSLERGTVPWQKPWTNVGGDSRPRNVRTGKPYRGINIFLLGIEAMLEGYTDPRWGTFKALREEAVATARREGRKIIEKKNARGREEFFEVIDGEEKWFAGGVRKGEKGTHIVLWKSIPKRDAEPDENGKQPMVWLLRDFVVFNVEQADGIELPEIEELPEPDRIEAADELVREYLEGPGPEFSYGGNRAFYNPARDSVRIPHLAQFDGAPEHYSTLFHELVHSTGHESRLKRTGWAGFGSDPYAKEELVAEMGAAMLSGLAGIDTTQENSAAYIANWLGVLKGDKKFVVSAAAQAQKAADLIVGQTWDEGAGDESAPVAREAVAA